VRRPNEKGHVEGGVKFTRKNYLVPVPKVNDLTALNAELEKRCRADLARRLRGRAKTKAALLAEDLRSMRELPKRPFEARRVAQTRVNSLSLVRFHCNDYSAPVKYAHQRVTAVGNVAEVRIVCNNQVIARHERCWRKEKVIYNPVHYLALLERKPGALDFAKPLEGWRLPECFGVLRRRLENREEGEGAREYIKVLRLLERFSLNELGEAVERALSVGAPGSEDIRLLVEHRRDRPVELFSLDGRPHLKEVEVDDVDLSIYSTLVEEQTCEARP